MEDHLFLQAQAQFLNSLPAKEQARLPSCDSAEKLLLAVNAMGPIQNAVSSQTKRSLLDHISSLVDVLRPYFDCIALIVGANSEIASPVWGAVRLALQVKAHIRLC